MQGMKKVVVRIAQLVEFLAVLEVLDTPSLLKELELD
jgi:hypothetical protein